MFDVCGILQWMMMRVVVLGSWGTHIVVLLYLCMLLRQKTCGHWSLDRQAGRQAASVSVVAIRYMQLMDILVQTALHNCTPILRETH